MDPSAPGTSESPDERAPRHGRRRRSAVAISIAGAALVALAAPAAAAPSDGNGRLPYATSGWPTLHGDSGNRKYQAGAQLADSYTSWRALDGRAVVAAPSTGPGGDLYVTTGMPAGQSNLHAYSRSGQPLWTSAPWQGDEGVDACAALSTPIVDTGGDIYVSDCDQVWAFAPDGRVKWSADLPAMPQDSPFAANPLRPNGFVTAFFTEGGSVGGVTLAGQVVVLDRDTGAERVPVLQLPSRSAPPATVPMPPTVYAGGQMDPSMREVLWQVAFGGSSVSANTPAVSPVTGRVFVVASGDEGTNGALYGLDIGDGGWGGAGSLGSVGSLGSSGGGAVKVAFVAPVGVGSGCSPTLSPDSRQVYTCDTAGTLYAVDAETGDISWTADANSEAGSMAMGPDGTVYTMARGGTYRAYSPTGTHLWDVDASQLAAQMLPANPNGPAYAIGGGTLTVVDGALVAPIVFGYTLNLGGRAVNAPVAAGVVEIDPATGVVRRQLVAADNPNEGTVPVLPDGTIVAGQGVMTTSSLAPLASAVGPLLPAGTALMPPRGGLQVFSPVS